MNHHNAGGGNATGACASCKHQRKKCDNRCPLSPYFPTEKSHEFQAVHRVFGVSNVMKMIMAVSEADRARLVESLICEALVRQKDPVGGMYGEYQKILGEVLYLRNLTRGQVLQIQQLQADIRRITKNSNNLVGVPRVAASPSLVRWNSSRGGNPMANINLGRGGATNHGNEARENGSCIIDAVPFAFQMDQQPDIRNENLDGCPAVEPSNGRV